MAAKPGNPLPPMLARTSGQMTPNDKPPLPPQETDKTLDMRPETLAPGEELTTNQGVTVSDDQNSLKSHVRGPTLLEDILMREKITHFDHERIPERVVHARGTAAHGVFQVYESQAHLTMAAPLQELMRTPWLHVDEVLGASPPCVLARATVITPGTAR